MSTDKDQRFIDAVERGMPTAMAAQAVYGTAVPPRPAAGDADFPYMLADTPEEFERVRGIGLPAAPDATAGDGLRSVLADDVARCLWGFFGMGLDWDEDATPQLREVFTRRAYQLLALPALRDVLAERDRTVAALRLIDRNGCENLTRSRCSDDPGRTRDSDYTSTQWCPPCIAADALDVP